MSIKSELKLDLTKLQKASLEASFMKNEGLQFDKTVSYAGRKNNADVPTKNDVSPASPPIITKITRRKNNADVPKNDVSPASPPIITKITNGNHPDLNLNGKADASIDVSPASPIIDGNHPDLNLNGKADASVAPLRNDEYSKQQPSYEAHKTKNTLKYTPPTNCSQDNKDKYQYTYKPKQELNMNGPRLVKV